MTYRERMLARAHDRDEARALAQGLPRPSTVRQADDGTWMVVQLLPARWEPGSNERAITSEEVA